MVGVERERFETRASISSTRAYACPKPARKMNQINMKIELSHAPLEISILIEVNRKKYRERRLYMARCVGGLSQLAVPAPACGYWLPANHVNACYNHRNRVCLVVLLL